MTSLEIHTKRIFNNLIKQNQKLTVDFILKQSKIVSSVKSPESSAQSPASSVQSSVSRVQGREFSVQGSESSVQRPTSRVQRRESSVESPASRVQSPESRVQSLTSNSCVQSPGIPVCRFFGGKIDKYSIQILLGKSILKLNSGPYEKYKHWYLGRWYIKLTLFKRF